MLGTTKSIIITKEDTIIMEGGGAKEAVTSRCETLRQQIADTTSEYEKEKFQERLAKLSGGVAVIKVGGASEVEVGEKKDRFTDALCATRAAVEQGIVPGGGVALLKASKNLEKLTHPTFDVNLGIRLIQRAIRAPARTIIENAGGDGAVIVGKILDSEQFDFGFDSSKGVFTDMLKAGILDPTKVVRTALMDASGVASLLTTSECVIVDSPEKNPPPPAGGGMGGMGGMGGGMGF